MEWWYEASDDDEQDIMSALRDSLINVCCIISFSSVDGVVYAPSSFHFLSCSHSLHECQLNNKEDHGQHCHCRAIAALLTGLLTRQGYSFQLLQLIWKDARQRTTGHHVCKEWVIFFFPWFLFANMSCFRLTSSCLALRFEYLLCCSISSIYFFYTRFLKVWRGKVDNNHDHLHPLYNTVVNNLYSQSLSYECRCSFECHINCDDSCLMLRYLSYFSMKCSC